MKLYHGTSSKRLERIRKHNLKPRGRRIGNDWGEYPSAPDRVYLTSSYAFYFSFSTAANDGSEPVVLEVEFPDFEEDLYLTEFLVPDEDGLAQHTFPVDHPLAKLNKLSLKQKTKWWRRHAPEHTYLTKPSIECIGNCAFMGLIPWKDEEVDGVMADGWGITKAVVVPEDYGLRFDPQISLMNHAILGANYAYALKKFMDSDGQADVQLHMEDSPNNEIWKSMQDYELLRAYQRERGESVEF